VVIAVVAVVLAQEDDPGGSSAAPTTTAPSITAPGVTAASATAPGATVDARSEVEGGGRDSDAFNVSAVERSRWNDAPLDRERDEEHATVAISGGHLVVHATAPSKPARGGLVTVCSYHGDFDARARFQLDQWPTGSGARVGISAAGAAIIRANELDGEEQFAVVVSEHPYGAPATALTGELRLLRIGSTISGYWRADPGDNWHEIGHDQGSTADSPVSLIMWGTTSTVTVAFDDFAIDGSPLCPR
jgi:hypothetical protein